jgi:hypothetical protein
LSEEFIKKGVNTEGIHKARRQQRDILYFVESEIQEDVRQEQVEAWAERNFNTDISFIEYIKLVLKTDNFMSVFKQIRFPLVSAQLVNDKIKPDIQRVFHAEDSYSKYTVSNKSVEQPIELNSTDFNEQLFDALFFRFNDIVITDIETTNSPRRKIIPIDNVVSIEGEGNIINKVGYSANLNGVDGSVYIDDKMFAFYPKDEKLEYIEVPHDLGRCPADFISNKSFNNFVVRKSIFSYVKTYMEDFVFLSAMRKMLDINGSIPSVTILKSNEGKKAKTQDLKGSSDKQPMASETFGGQSASKKTNADPNQLSPQEAGAKTTIPVNYKNDGSIDTNYVQDFIKYNYAPVDILKFVDERIEKLEKKIVSSIVGNYSEMNKAAVNEQQVNQSTVSMEDRLRDVSKCMSRVVERTDYNFLGLKYGTNGISVDVSFGTDFFLATAGEIYDLINKAPNPIEARNLLGQLAKSKGQSNQEKAKRDEILYKLLPYVTAANFKDAVDNNAVGEITFQYYTRFTHWIDIFEATHDDIYQFWLMLDNDGASDSAKLVEINNLIIQIIKSNYEQAKEPIAEN